MFLVAPGNKNMIIFLIIFLYNEKNFIERLYNDGVREGTQGGVKKVIKGKYIWIYRSNEQRSLVKG